MNASSLSSVAITNGRIAWPVCPSEKQYFSFPSLKMAMNPSNSKFYNKLIQSCKYFFERNPILVVRKMEEISICSNEDCTAYSYDDAPCCVRIDIKKIKSKFWFTQKLMADYLRMDESPNITFTSLLCPKLFRCEIDNLRICDKIVLFEDFKYLASFATYVTLSNVKMIHKNGKVVMLEKILEAIPNIETFICYLNEDCSMVTNATFKNILKLKNLGNLKRFSLLFCSKNPENIYVEDLSRFIKDYKNTKFWFNFCGDNDIVNEHLKNQLDVLVDTIIGSNAPNRMIKYIRQDEEKLKVLQNRFCKN